MQRQVLSRFEPTVYDSKLFYFTSRPYRLYIGGSTLVLFLFALFEELVWNERRKKSNAWCFIAQLIQNKVEKATPGVWSHSLFRTKQNSNAWC